MDNSRLPGKSGENIHKKEHDEASLCAKTKLVFLVGRYSCILVIQIVPTTFSFIPSGLYHDGEEY